MKRMLCIALASAMLLCGCQSAALTPDETRGTEDVTEEITEEVTEQVTELVTEPQVELPIPGVTFPIGGEENGLTLGRTDRVRIGYNGNARSVRYITAADQLPDHEAFAGYDEAYFENKALVLVTETVGSGSVELDIASIVDGVVTLSYDLHGDAGTADMATWLVWAEVEAGLDYDWSLAGSGPDSGAVTH